MSLLGGGLYFAKKFLWKIYEKMTALSQCKETYSKIILDILLEMKEAVSLKLTASFLNMAPPAGLEPATYGLTVHRSTD